VVLTAAHQKILAAGNVAKFTDNLTKNLVRRSFCMDSGLLVGANCGLDLRGNRTRTGWYYKNEIPATECDVHVAVPYCTETNCVAGPNCENTRTVALIRVTRYFDKSIAIRDAQYTYMDMPAGAKYPMSTNYSYFTYTYPPGKYSGYTNLKETGADHPANAYCSLHNPDDCI
jgi:hypothetical protein